MSGVPITIVGLATADDGTTKNVTIVGMASITGLGVGGGPILPGDKPPKPPLGIWPNPPEGIAPHPEHPIVIPPPPGGGEPPEMPPGLPIKPPPPQGGWGYHPEYGWGYFPGPGQATPK